jgi:hypothetical protein
VGSYPLAQHRAAEKPHCRDQAANGGGKGEDFEVRAVVGAGGVHRVEAIEVWKTRAALGKHVRQEEVSGGKQATDDGDEGEAFEGVVVFGGAGVHGGEWLGVSFVSQNYDSSRKLQLFFAIMAKFSQFYGFSHSF